MIIRMVRNHVAMMARRFVLICLLGTALTSAQAQGNADDITEARKILEQAVQTVGPVRMNVDKYVFLKDITAMQALYGDLPGALKTTAILGDVFDRESVLQGIVVAQAYTGDVHGALQTAMTITNPFQKDHTIQKIACLQARTRDVKGALQTLALVQIESFRVLLLEELMQLRLSEVNWKDQTSVSERLQPFIEIDEKMVDTIRDYDFYQKEIKAYALISIAEAQTMVGNATKALQVANTIQEEKFKIEALQGIATFQARTGDIRGGLQTAARIKGQSQKDEALRSIARAQATAGDIQGALLTTNSIRSENEKNSALRGIAAAQAKAGDRQGAMQTANRIQGKESQDEALVDIAAAQAGSGNVKEARETFQLINQEGNKVRVLHRIAVSQARAGDIQGAFDTLVTIQEDKLGIERAKQDVIAPLSETGDITRALQLASTLLVNVEKAKALRVIARAHAKKAQPREVLAWIHQETAPLPKAYALLGAAEGILERTDPRKSLPQIDSLLFHRY